MVLTVPLLEIMSAPDTGPRWGCLQPLTRFIQHVSPIGGKGCHVVFKRGEIEERFEFFGQGDKSSKCLFNPHYSRHRTLGYGVQVPD